MHGMETAMDEDDDDEIEQQLSSMIKGKRRVVEGFRSGGLGSGINAVGDKVEKVPFFIKFKKLKISSQFAKNFLS